MRTSKRSSRRRAFTLLEVLMVIVILGILVAVVSTQIVGQGERARVDLTRTEIKGKLVNAVEQFRLHMNRLPESLEELLNKPTDDESAKRWGGPYIDKASLKDAWEREYHYELDSESMNGYMIGSEGKDGSWGTDDDIKSTDE